MDVTAAVIKSTGAMKAKRMNSLRVQSSRLRRTDFSQILERIDPAAVFIRPFDLQGVIANQLSRQRRQRLRVISGKNL
jgi:hypothetical protein